MRLGEIIATLDKIAPFELAESWDNVGIMVGDPDQEITSLLLTLDPSLAAIQHAVLSQADLIITHHPLFFKPLKNLNLQDTTAHKASLLIRNSIALVSMHTNLDSAPEGVADTLARSLELKDIQAAGMLRMGWVEPMSLGDWVNKLPLKARVCHGRSMVNRVAVCPGSGMDLWQEARDLGCDTFVTGDVKYHAARDATEAGLNIIDLGHFGSEQIILKPLHEKLSSAFATVSCSLFEEQDVFITT